jgi:hypothetical protein
MDQRGNASTLRYQVCIFSWSPIWASRICKKKIWASRSLVWTIWNTWSYFTPSLLLRTRYRYEPHTFHQKSPSPSRSFSGLWISGRPAFFWDSDKLAVAENLVSEILLYSCIYLPLECWKECKALTVAAHIAKFDGNFKLQMPISTTFLSTSEIWKRQLTSEAFLANRSECELSLSRFPLWSLPPLRVPSAALPIPFSHLLIRSPKPSSGGKRTKQKGTLGWHLSSLSPLHICPTYAGISISNASLLETKDGIWSEDA